jgi:glyceraldehyde 3-phosphate dehydrogenase-like protein
MLRVAINGLGRIGRATLKIVMDTPDLQLVAVNELASAADIVYLLKYDTVYGRYDRAVRAVDGTLFIGANKVTLAHEADPRRAPWRTLQVDVVFECTGAFARHDDLAKHVQAGASYVILSAPAIDEEIETIIHGVNTPNHQATIISCASCTTNCITPIMEILSRRIGIRKAVMTAIHAYTSSQRIVDGPHKHLPRRRAGAANFVPASTGAATATAKALPSTVVMRQAAVVENSAANHPRFQSAPHIRSGPAGPVSTILIESADADVGSTRLPDRAINIMSLTMVDLLVATRATYAGAVQSLFPEKRLRSSASSRARRPAPSARRRRLASASCPSTALHAVSSEG